MAWNFLVAEIVPDDRLIRPTIGLGYLTRDEAHHVIQACLDRVPAFNTIAALWRQGAQNDTVYWGPTNTQPDKTPTGQPWPGSKTSPRPCEPPGVNVQVAAMPEDGTP